jgi:CheY-like chemotaxis protein
LAADGAAAFARMAAGAPALLILDWELPGVTPRVVAAAARQAFGASLPIVVLAPDERGPRLATELGAAAWVREPIAPEALLAAVRRALGADADGGPSLGEAHCWDEARQS